MTTSFATRLDALSRWKKALEQQLDSFGAFLSNHELVDAAGRGSLNVLRQRCVDDKLTLAFVAEFSRDQSELINAIFFADTGRRVLPSVLGQTTLCPLELGYDDSQPPSLALLPWESRRDGATVAQLRADSSAWAIVRLEGRSPSQLAEALAEVMRTKRVSQSEACELGFCDEMPPQDNSAPAANGWVEVPAWRYALVNYPHPLLKSGLVMLNACRRSLTGAEPDLTRSLLPSAHVTVVLVEANSGVNESCLAIWRDHLMADKRPRLVVLDKIHTLRDPLLAPDEVSGQINSLRQATACALDIPVDRVFALSAQEALIARVEGDALALKRSGVLDLENVLGLMLQRQQRELLATAVHAGAQQLHASATKRLGERRRQIAEQLLELRELQGQSGAKVRAMLHGVDMDMAKFERCTSRLLALKVVHSRMVKVALLRLTRDKLREEVARTQQEAGASFLYLGAKKALVALFERLREALSTAQMRSKEIYSMLGGSFEQFNADFGFRLVLQQEPVLTFFMNDLSLIERAHVQHLGLMQALRFTQPVFRDEFYRRLVSKLRRVFETASRELDLWNRAALEQMDSQLRERRRSFKRRREALERVQTVTSELGRHINQIEAQDVQLQQLQTRVGELANELLRQTSVDHDHGGALGSSVMPYAVQIAPIEPDEASCELAAS